MFSIAALRCTRAASSLPAAFAGAALAEISFCDPAERKVLVQVRPVEPKRRNFDSAQLRDGTGGEPRILRDRKAVDRTALHRNHDAAVFKPRFAGYVSQDAHSTFRL